MGKKLRDAQIFLYVVAHPEIEWRSVERVAKELGLTEHEVREAVHLSTRVEMIAKALGWHVVELTKIPIKDGVDNQS